MESLRTSRKYSLRGVCKGDFGVLWQAQQDGCLLPEPVTPAFFGEWLDKTFARYNEVLIVEQDGIPCCFVAAFWDGWKYEPHVEFFKCSARTKLESTLWFFSQMQGKPELGVTVVKCLLAAKPLFDRVVAAGYLKYVGMMEQGDYRGHEFIYAVAGSRKSPAGV